MADSASRLCRLASRNLAILTERPGVPGLIVAIMTFLLVVRAGLFPGTGGDDGEQLIFSQFFDWGYQVRNPPLYTWMVIAVSAITGPTLWAVNIVKFSLLTGMYLFMWRAARRLIQDQRLAALAGLSPVLFYYLAWEAVTGFSHTVLAACLYAAVIWLFLRLRDDGGRWTDYIALGLAIGLGAMAKYAFWIFLAALIVASLTDREMRNRLRSPRMLVALAVAVAVAAPHYLWLIDRLDILAGQAGESVANTAQLSLTGLAHGAKAAVGFLAPFWIAALFCFPRAFRPRLDAVQERHPMARVLGWQMTLILAGTAGGALVLPDFRIRTHYMVVLLPFCLWLLARAEATAPPSRRVGAFAAALTLALFAAPVGMVGKYVFEPLICGRCQHHIPYRDLVAKIRDLGFKGGTVVAYWHPDPLPGNLRAALPDARVISLKHQDVIPPLAKDGADGGGQCLVVWSADGARDNRPTAVSGANSLLNAGIPADARQKLIIAPLAGLPLMTGGKNAALGVILSDGRGDCR
jgi:hypothetical protein